ncbi:MAG: hypothetical protein E7490_07860 [Ruminococcaceae bacterium]|nr:hypothetical protein [Oscillospiraceae bacterium]
MDKNIFYEAIPTAEQKIRLKKRIFEEQTEAQDNKMKKVSPFKTAAAVAAAFVLVVGAVALVAIVANMGGTGIDYVPQNSGSDRHEASNGGVDDPESVVIGTTDLKAKYPQYFDLDTSKGLVVYTWFTPQVGDEDVCILVPGKNIGYTDDEILSMPVVSVSEMKEILKSYNVSSDKISVAFFKHPSLATAGYDADSFLNKICKELGLENKVQDLSEKYPKYFNLDTTDGLAVYTWKTESDPQKDMCVLLPGKDKAHAEHEIVTSQGISVAEMKEILASYLISPENISVRYFDYFSPSIKFDNDQALNRHLLDISIQLGIVADHRDKYPTYYALDTINGLKVYVWQPAPDSYSCVLVEGKNNAYTDDEILALPEATLADMKEILSSYDIPTEMIEVAIFEHPTSGFKFDINQDFIPMIRERLGIALENDDAWGINMSVAFKNDTEFVLSIGQTLPEGVHMDGKLTTSPEYVLYVDYEGKRITYQEYAKLKGLSYKGPFAWDCVLYTIEENGWLILNEDISLTYGKLPEGKYYIKKDIVYYGNDGKSQEKSYFAEFIVEPEPTMPEDEKDAVVSVVNGVDVKLGEGEFFNGNENILSFNFAVVYDTPHNFYHDTFTENGGDIPLIFPADENTVYKTIEVGDKLSPDFTVTEASFNCNVIKGAGNIIENLDPKMSENRLRAEGNVTVTAYAYKQKYDNGTSEVMVIVDPRKDMNGEITLYRLYRERLYDFRYVSENGGLFEATSSTPVMKLSQVDGEKFDKTGLWEVELDITAIEMVYTERGGQSFISPEISDIRFIKEIEVSDPVAE